jgi:hypothetical protein
MKVSKVSAVIGSMLVAALVSVPASAQTTGTPPPKPTPAVPPPAPEPPAPAKPWTLTAGVDFASAYMFRGIFQQSGGAIVQPSVDLGMTLAPGVTANVGTWNSIHSKTISGLYESDFYGSVTFTVGKLHPGLLYTSYTSPNNSFTTVNEIAGVLSFDDSASKVPFSPKIILAFELGPGQADGGTKKGTYLELGVRPAVKVAPKLTLAVPVKLGMSVRNYYEGPVKDNTFGYLDIGLQGSVPVVSGKSGSLEAHAGVDFLTLGDSMKALNFGDRVKPVVMAGVTFTY